MRLTRALPLLLLGLVHALLCTPTTYGQIPKRLERCLPYPTFAEEVQEMKQGSELKVQADALQEKARVIESVRFDGPTPLPNRIQQKFVTELGEDASPERIDDFVETEIRGTLQDEGYFKANATAEARVVSEDASTQLVALTIHVDEGPQFFLGSLQFRSSDPDVPLAFGQDELRKRVSLQEGDVFSASRIRDSLEALRKLYVSQGYIDWTATPLVEFDDSPHHVVLTIELDQQKKYRVGWVTVLGLDPATENGLKAKPIPGDVFDPGSLKAFLAENKSALPSDASMEDVTQNRNAKTGIVDIIFDFLTCPHVKE